MMQDGTGVHSEVSERRAHEGGVRYRRLISVGARRTLGMNRARDNPCRGPVGTRSPWRGKEEP